MSIKQQYITDAAGKQYAVTLSYDRDARRRGYYVNISPCELDNAGNGFYSCAVRLFDPESVRSCLKEVKRASKAAQAEALEQYRAALDIYFAPRGIAHVSDTIPGAIEYAQQRKEWCL